MVRNRPMQVDRCPWLNANHRLPLRRRCIDDSKLGRNQRQFSELFPRKWIRLLAIEFHNTRGVRFSAATRGESSYSKERDLLRRDLSVSSPDTLCFEPRRIRTQVPAYEFVLISQLTTPAQRLEKDIVSWRA